MWYMAHSRIHCAKRVQDNHRSHLNYIVRQSEKYGSNSLSLSSCVFRCYNDTN